jgi:hypothetical protein
LLLPLFCHCLQVTVLDCENAVFMNWVDHSTIQGGWVRRGWVRGGWVGEGWVGGRVGVPGRLGQCLGGCCGRQQGAGLQHLQRQQRLGMAAQLPKGLP